MNILTFDTEEWFHLLDNDSTRDERQWIRYEKRIDGNVGRLIDILDSTNADATFFIVGWIAKTYPQLVKRIAERFDIGSHTMNHQLVWQQTPEEFRNDVESSIHRLEDLTGKKIKAFRAPGFSIRKSEVWAYEILHELGIEIDCSVFPTHHAHGGMAEYPGQVPAIIEHNGIQIKELPIVYTSILKKHVVFSGGGYFRLFPYPLIKRWSKQHPAYMMAYIHPRDLDANQPLIKELNLLRRFKSYYGLKGAERKLRTWLTDFDFIDIKTAQSQINWNEVPTIHL